MKRTSRSSFASGRARRSAGRKPVLLLFALVGVAALLAGLEAGGVTDVLKKSQVSPPPPINDSGDPGSTGNQTDIDYSPAKPSDNQEINKQKESDPGGAPSNPPSSSELSVIMTRAALDTDNVVRVRAQVYGATAGTCTISLTKKDSSKAQFSDSKTVSSLPNGTYSCGTDIAKSQLDAGTWDAKVLLNAGGKTAVSETLELTIP